MMRFIRSFAVATAGVSAIEFALISPALLFTYFGIAEVANYVLAARKVAAVASTAADLVSQDTAVTDAEMDDIMDSLKVILRPFDDGSAQIIISEVSADEDGVLTWSWSDARNDTPHTPGTAPSADEVPADIVANGQGIIVAEISFTYQTLFGMYLSNGMTLTDKFYLKPRRSAHVTRE